MAFELRHRKHLEDELTSLFRRELRKAIRALTHKSAASAADIHEARKHLKKARAITALLEQAGVRPRNGDRKRLKSASRALSALRDSDAIITTLNLAHRRFPKRLPQHTYQALRQRLIDARDAQAVRARRKGALDDVVEQLGKTRKSAKSWSLPSMNVETLDAAIADAYRRSRRAMERARKHPHATPIHEWRKAVKTLWHHLSLAGPLKTGTAPFRAGLKRLEKILGRHHDLVVLEATIRICDGLRAADDHSRNAARITAGMRRPLAKRALSLGRRLHAKKPRAFARWLRDRSKG